jgi:oligopeptide/dipeptide ABC transporter ATP-binding protein
MIELVKVDRIKKVYTIKKGLVKKKVIHIKAVDGVSFSVEKGETFGLVGESGCGKTTMARMILRLIEPTENTIYYQKKDIFSYNRGELKDFRKDVGIVFQDPAASLNPRSTIMDSLRRPLTINGFDRKSADQRIYQVSDQVRLSRTLLKRYPHQLSGGQQQRVSIARAIVLKQQVLVLDEPTSALDISVQAQILNLLIELQKEQHLTYLLISHDLNVVKYISDRIGVMYLGKMVELGTVKDIYQDAKHPYTFGLMSSSPIFSPHQRDRGKLRISGELPGPISVPLGCRFHTRCPYTEDICKKEIPLFEDIGSGHYVACHRHTEINFP